MTIYHCTVLVLWYYDLSALAAFAGKAKIIDIIGRSGAGNVLLTSYSAMRKHQNHLLRYNWHYLILDEGHTV